MQPVFSHFKKMDWILIGAVLLLVIFGLVSLYSICSGKNDFSNFNKQLIFFGVGLVLMLALSFMDWRALRDGPYLILILYFLCLIFLTGLFFFAPEIRGTKSWYKLGPVSFDPIEFTNIVMIILLAKYFSLRHVEMYRIWHIILSGVYFLIPCSLIFFQPNLGAILILFVLWVGMLLISGIKIRHFLFLCLFFLLIFTLSWSFFLQDYQKERLIGFLFPQHDPLGVSWSQNQSKIAIGAGGLTGQGLGQGSQTQYGFLPEAHTDFIFAAIAEETGLIGVLVLLVLFSILIWRVIKIANSAQTNFPRLFASGFALLFFAQVFINIGMNLGILPIIGIPLPFVSYGGSNLLGFYFGIGILASFTKRA